MPPHWCCVKWKPRILGIPPLLRVIVLITAPTSCNKYYREW